MVTRPDSLMPMVAEALTETQPPFDMKVAVLVNAPGVGLLKRRTIEAVAPGSRLYVVPDAMLNPGASLSETDPSRCASPVFCTVIVRSTKTPSGTFAKSTLEGVRAK